MFKIARLPDTPQLKTDLLIFFLEEITSKNKKINLPEIVSHFQSLFDYPLSYGDFKGKFKEQLLLYPNEPHPVKRIALIGVGRQVDRDLNDSRMLGYEVGRIQEKTAAKRVHIALSGSYLHTEEQVAALSEGLQFQKYRFELYKKKDKKDNSKAQFLFLFSGEDYTSHYKKVIEESRISMDAVKIARDLSNEPSNICTPEFIKDFVINHFRKMDHISVEALDRDKLQELSFHAMLSVAKGSREKPYLLIIRFTPDRKKRKTLAVVGKGVTFDSGGISIKPSRKMDEMKFDMAGGAAVIAFMDAVARLKPRFEVVGVVPLVENMPGSRAFKPGDIIKACNGKTIEILNTDAEGRLILADAIAYTVERFKPAVLLDLATLTGSVLHALGDKAAGLFSNSDSLRDLLVSAAEKSGDYLWPLPLWKMYDEDIKSNVADIKNLGDNQAGAIAAAKFLEQFAGNVKWAHIDMAGTAYDVKNIDFLGKGATGYGPRLLIQAMNHLEALL